jgi:hypothetical protein
MSVLDAHLSLLQPAKQSTLGILQGDSPPSRGHILIAICKENCIIEALSARGAYPTFSWFLAIARIVQDLFVKYLTMFMCI